ncbi:MAG TPA: hypothetical protein VFR23_11600 [Jiangellaceae bacterium]|nr:hypothetical protein [Jiangellaceae bacterium]
MDYANLLRQAIARLEADPTLLHSEEARQIMITWMVWGIEGIESGDLTRRALNDPEGQPGIRMARLLVGHARHP